MSDQILTVTNVRVAINVGDHIIMPWHDPRSWWQRLAPLWLGGRVAPPKEYVITDMLTGNGGVGTYRIKPR